MLFMDGTWFSVDEIGIHRKGNSLMEPPSHIFAYKRLGRTPKDYRLGSAWGVDQGAWFSTPL